MEFNFEGLTNLVYDRYYKFLASLGALIIVLSLFFPTFPFERIKVLEMGSVLVIFGLIGWFIDNSWEVLENNLELKWQHNIAKTDLGSSPYENMDYDSVKLGLLVILSRMLVVGGLIITEIWIYLYR